MRFAFDNFVLDCDQSVLCREGKLIPLSPKVFETLRLLVLSAGRVVTKQEFMDALWPDSFVEDSNLTQNIFVLRKVLGTSADGRPYIDTVPKRGYRFVGAALPEALGTPESANAQMVDHIVEPPDATGITPEPSGPKTLVPGGEGSLLLPAHSGPRVTLGRALVFSIPFLLVFFLGGYLALHSQRPMQVGGYQRLTNDGLSKDLLYTHATLVPDGNRLFFTEMKGDEPELAQASTGGGETIYSPLPARDAQPVGLDPSGGRLLFGSILQIGEMHSLMTKDLTTGAFEPVFDLRAHDASWSSDGKRLAYSRFGELFVRSADGSIQRVASVEGIVYWPRWSPDGRVLRFSESYEGFHDRLWEVDSSGANLHQLFTQRADSGSLCCGSWTDSGRAFMYMSNALRSSSIHVQLEPRASWYRWFHPAQTAIDIPSAPLDNWAAAVPSADGKHIYAIGEQLRGQVMRIDPLTRKPEVYLGGISAEGVNYSPDRQNVVWTAYPEGTLWRSRIDGSGRSQLTQGPMVARFPHWSPDGSTIVFIAARPGSDWQLYTVPAQGGAAKLLLQEPGDQGVATWSVDGKSLAFGHGLDMAEARTHPPAIDIYRISDRHRTIVPGSTGLWTARWSPDGRFLSAVTRDNHTLRLYDLEKKTWADLATGSVNDVIWTLDGKYIYFDTGFGFEPMLYRVRLSDRKVEVWAKLKNVRRAGFFAPWLGVAADGAPILLEDASIQELYSIAVNLP